jgi:hypothetical protein
MVRVRVRVFYVFSQRNGIEFVFVADELFFDTEQKRKPRRHKRREDTIEKTERGRQSQEKNA